ncbi:MAG: DUF4402 domain-containing protein [Phenylobacterium sp.]
MRKLPPWLAPLVLLAWSLGSGGAWAQTYGVGISASTPNLGLVASATSGDTVFTIASSTGAVTKASGNGARISTGTTRATVTVTCGNQNQCNSTDVDVKIGVVGTPTNRARALTNFNVAMGTATLSGSVTGTSPITFRIGPIGKNSSKSFFVGANFPVAGDDSGKPTGAGNSGFYVFVAKANTTPTTGSSAGVATVTAYKQLSLSKTSNLSFGRVVRPLSGSGTVSVSATTGTRTITAGVALSTPSPTRASYTATGEANKQISVTVPSAFNMTGPATIVVTLTNDTLGLISLSSGGTFTFNVGGSFPISSTTVNGAYSGSFLVQVDYN